MKPVPHMSLQKQVMKSFGACTFGSQLTFVVENTGALDLLPVTVTQANLVTSDCLKFSSAPCITAVQL